jgi:hypothetical protein
MGPSNVFPGHLTWEGALTSDRTYDAFISYRGADATAAAAWVDFTLRRYKLPPQVRLERSRPIRVFRDKVFRKAGTTNFLDDFLKKALEQSEWLVVLATKRALEKSSWVSQEIGYFLNVLGRKDRLIVLWIDGAANDPLPGDLHVLFPHIHRVDLTGLRLARRFRWPLPPSPRVELTAAVASILGVPNDQMERLRADEKRLVRRNRAAVAGSVILAATVALVVGMKVSRQPPDTRSREEAEMRGRLASIQQQPSMGQQGTRAALEVAAWSQERDGNLLPWVTAGLKAVMDRDRQQWVGRRFEGEVPAFLGGAKAAPVPLAVSGSGMLFVSDRDALRRWQLRPGASPLELPRLRGEALGITQLVAAESGAVVGWNAEGDVQLWPSDQAPFRLSLSAKDKVAALAVSANGDLFAVGTTQGKVLLVSPEAAGQAPVELDSPGHPPIAAVAIGKDSQSRPVVAAASGTTVRRWSRAGDRWLRHEGRSMLAVSSLVVEPDGTLLSGGADGLQQWTHRLTDQRAGLEGRSLHTGPVRVLVARGPLVVALAEQTNIIVKRAEGLPLETISAPRPVGNISLTSDGRLAYVDNESVGLMDLDGLHLGAWFDMFMPRYVTEDNAADIVFSPPEIEQVAIQRAWKSKITRIRLDPAFPSHDVELMVKPDLGWNHQGLSHLISAQLGPGQRESLLGIGVTGYLSRWDWSGDTKEGQTIESVPPRPQVGRPVALQVSSGTVMIATEAQILLFPWGSRPGDPTLPATHLMNAVLHADARLITVLDDGFLLTKDRTGTVVKAYPGRFGLMAWSRSGRTLAAANTDRVMTWTWGEENSGRTILHPGLPQALAVSPDGRLVAVGDQSGFTIYDPSGNALGRFPAGQMRALSFHPSGQIVASFDTQSILRLWRIDAGDWIKLACRREAGEPIMERPAAVTRLCARQLQQSYAAEKIGQGARAEAGRTSPPAGR